MDANHDAAAPQRGRQQVRVTRTGRRPDADAPVDPRPSAERAERSWRSATVLRDDLRSPFGGC